MVKIRLRRTGKKKQPSYRLVVADSRSPRDGRFIEIVGYYLPVRQPKVLEINAERVRYWIGTGAQPSDTVAYLLKKKNILDEHGKLTSDDATASTPVVAAPVAKAAAPAPAAQPAAPVAESATSEASAVSVPVMGRSAASASEDVPATTEE